MAEQSITVLILSREDIQRVQSKIEMGIKCKAELESEIVLIEKKKQKLLK